MMKKLFCMLLLCAAAKTFAAPVTYLDPLSEKDMKLNTTLLRMFELADPYLGTVADQPVPGKAEFSYFREKKVDDARLFFDVGNNAINAAVSPRGAIHRAMIFTGTGGSPNLPQLPGVWLTYNYLNFCHDTTFSFKTNAEFIDAAAKGLNQETSLIIGAFPLTKVRINDLIIRQLIMAPIVQENRVRCLFVGFYVETESLDGVSATLGIPNVRAVSTYADDVNLGIFKSATAREAKTVVSVEKGYAEFLLLDGIKSKSKTDSVDFFVKKGRPVWLPLLLVMGETNEEFQRNRDWAKSLTSQTLITETMEYFSNRMGEIKISGSSTPISSIIRRSMHAQLVTPLRDGKGISAGSSWGSDPSERCDIGQFNFVWMADLFFNFLSAGMISPDIYIDGIQFSMTRSVPQYPSLFFTAKDDNKLKQRPHSLGNTVIPIVLAGKYYSLTGDGQTLKHIEAKDPASGKMVSLSTVTEQLLENLLRTIDQNAPMLCESNYISDGPSRGKYHTGSNILAWYAFESAGRLFAEVFGNREKGEKYRVIAKKMKEDIYKYCTVEYQGHTMFCEGYQSELLHDGEESVTNIAPFLGFCSADDPAMLRFQKFACSENNPIWDNTTKAFVWENQYVTSPGFITLLASSDTEKELVTNLDRLCALADVDGQWWWWPLEKNSTGMRRAWAGKCGWATGVFLIRFVNSIAGVDWDAPAKTLTVKPFVPWDDFECSGLKLGSLRLDMNYHNNKKGAKIVLSHNQPMINELAIILRAPSDTNNCKMIQSTADYKLTKGKPYYGKQTWEILIKDLVKSSTEVQLEWN